MYIVIFILTLIGLLTLAGVTPYIILNELQSIRQSKAVILQKKYHKKLFISSKKPKWYKWYMRAESLLQSSNHNISMDIFLQISILCCVLGVLVGIVLKNIFLAIVLGAGLAISPFLYLHHVYYKYLKALNSSINLGLALITNSYYQIEDIVKACQENLERLEEPLKQIVREFVIEVEIINPDIKAAIQKMKNKVDNCYFFRWCDILIQCQDDRDFKNVLPAIISEMSESKKNQSEYDIMMREVHKSYMQLVLISVFSVPTLKIVFEDMYIYLVNTLIGKLLVAVMYAILFIATSFVVMTNKPVSIS